MFTMTSRHIASTIAAITLLSQSTTALAAFSDVPAAHADVQAIQYVQKNLIFNGKPVADGVMHFDPNASLNRAELVTILVRALGVDIQIGSQACFKDVSTAAWYFKSVCTAERMGIVSGYPDGSFKPAQTVNKVEALKIITNALGLSSEVEMYASWDEGNDWYSPYVTLAREWKLLDDIRTQKKLDAPMNRSDAAHLLYRSIITGMHRTVTGDFTGFSDELAAQYSDRTIELQGLEQAHAFEQLYANGQEYRYPRLGFSLLLPKTMPTYMCGYEEVAAIVPVKTIEKGNDVHIGPAWYEEPEYLGDNPDGSGRYGACKKHDMVASEYNYFTTRIIRTRIVRNDKEIETFIRDTFGTDCGPFERTPSLQNGIEDIHVKNVSRPGITHPQDLGDLACAMNYMYVVKYNPLTHRILAVNLGQEAFFHLTDPDGTLGYPLDFTIMRTLRMF